MSTSTTKITNKLFSKKKSNNLIITPLFSNYTTANTTNKNTLINSRIENLNSNDYTEKENFSQNIIFKVNNNSINLKSKKSNKYKNILNVRNSPLKQEPKNNLVKIKEYSKNKGIKNRSNDNKNLNININFNSKKNNNNKNNKNKNEIIVIDKIIKKKNSNYIFKLESNHISFTKERKKNLSKEDINKVNKKCNNNILNKNKKKQTNILSYDIKKYNLNKFNKKALSRNSILKISSSARTNKVNNIQKLSNNSKNRTQNDKNIYFKKKIDDSFKYINLKNINNKSQKYSKNHLNSKYNIDSNNYLVNLFFDGKKNDKNIILKSYMVGKTSLDAKNKSNLCHKYKDSKNLIENNNKNNSNSQNKNSIPKPIISRNKNKNNSKKESLMKGLSTSQNIKTNNIKNFHKIIQLRKNSDNIDKKFIYRNMDNFISMESKSLPKKNIDNIIDETQKKIIIKNENTPKKVCLKKRSQKNLEKNCITSNNSVNKSKDNIFDYLLETNRKTKNNLEKNESSNAINNIKVNNFNIQKPKEENMKFTLLKNKFEENDSIQDINKSKIIIGNIDGYEDIIESDKINNKLNQKEKTINLFEYNTIDNEKTNKSKNWTKKLNLNLLEETDNNSCGLEIYNFNNLNNNNGFINDSEIKSFLNCIEDEYEFDDMSTTILKKNKNIINRKSKSLLPFHVNKISYIKIYDSKTNKYLVNELINNENVLLVDNKNDKNDNFINIEKKNIKSDLFIKDRININEEFFKEKDLLLKNKINYNINKRKDKKIKNFIYLENNLNKRLFNFEHNVIENSCSFSIEGMDKKCNIF